MRAAVNIPAIIPAMDIPGYKIQREIGKGGMATVYLAIQESLGRPVVLKVMSASLDTTPEFNKRFLNEGHILASVTHPNIITIYDIGIAEDCLYISMEYLGGGDLGQKIALGMSPEEALDVLSRVATALSVAHAKNIVHRDVKPANILYREGGTPVLTDFGIAKLLGDNELTSTGTILGSPYYMSPEQAEGRLALDGRSDIYSLGIILHEMLTGSRPYDGDSAIHIVLQHLQAPVPTLPRNLSGFQPLLDLMLAKKRDDRFRDAAALVAYVSAIMAPEAPESAKVLKRHAPRPLPASAPRPYAQGQMTQRMAAVKRRRVRNWTIFGMGVLALAGIMAWYFITQISQYRRIAVAPAHKPRPAIEQSVQPAPGGVPGNAQPAPRHPPQAVVATEPDAFQRQVLTALKWLGRKSLEDQRLTVPPQDNAYYYFNRLLEIEPHNPEALEGIAEIAHRYANMAEDQIRKKNYHLAESYVTEGLKVDPDNKQLQVLRSSVQLRERSFFDDLISLFRSHG